jgi:hypothetical protein
MAKEKLTEKVLANFDWDSPPNNRFKAWPIELKSPVNKNQEAHGEKQSGSDGTQEKRQAANGC